MLTKLGTSRVFSGRGHCFSFVCFNHHKSHVSAVASYSSLQWIPIWWLSKSVITLKNLWRMHLYFLKSFGFWTLPNISEREKLKEVHDIISVYTVCLMHVIYQLFRKAFVMTTWYPKYHPKYSLSHAHTYISSFHNVLKLQLLAKP